jgi:hypothetical protein
MSKKRREKKIKKSMFGHYVTAALIAARMGISIGYAFERYVKPNMQKGPIRSFTPEEASELAASGCLK